MVESRIAKLGQIAISRFSAIFSDSAFNHRLKQIKGKAERHQVHPCGCVGKPQALGCGEECLGTRKPLLYQP